ncbi:hypothetical protein EON64_06460 [archaeon]|nr:MAG: hypothetical protein EON64_06460 [archaeon]
MPVEYTFFELFVGYVLKWAVLYLTLFAVLACWHLVSIKTMQIRTVNSVEAKSLQPVPAHNNAMFLITNFEAANLRKQGGIRNLWKIALHIPLKIELNHSNQETVAPATIALSTNSKQEQSICRQKAICYCARSAHFQHYHRDQK